MWLYSSVVLNKYLCCEFLFIRPEPNMLKILPIILSRISLNFLLLFFFILVPSQLFHNNAHLVSLAIVA